MVLVSLLRKASTNVSTPAIVQKHFRDDVIMPADKDLQTHIEHALRDLLPSEVSEGLRSILEEWLQKNIQKERNGWAERLQMAMKEIERERRQAVEIYSQIDEMNAKFAPFQHLIGHTREASVYASSDHDLKVYRLNQLNRSIDAMLKMASGNVDTDEMDAVELVSVTTQDGQESATSTSDNAKVAALQRSLAIMTQKVKAQMREINELDEQRRDEIKHLGDTINAQNEKSEKQKKKSEQQIEELKAIVTSQRVKLRQKGRHERSTSMTDKGVNVSIRLPRRHVCTQVDENSIARAKLGLLNKMEEEQKKVSSVPESSKSTNGISKSEVWDMNSPLITPWNNHTSKLRKTKSCFASDFKLLKSVAIANDVISSQHSLVQQWLSTSPGSIERENVDSLRSQVVDFAKKLEKARHDMDTCQRQMALMKVPSVDSPRSSEIERELKQIETNDGRRTPTEIKNGVQGDLDRRKVGADRDLVLKLKSIQTKQNDASNFVYKPPKIKAKCLRCHLIYVCKEDKAQCRYHPKPKRKIERYDAKDKMIKMVLLWECCLQPSESRGCCVGDHI
ncbi:hypothetical protein CAPTEDRAFT_213201 [Capitella teleta]|uniref:Uncharacterized protein n=1 Tax=Capitella teleta TaxID=283909 RepID=R7TWU8_CAPTE|nr:hypothetical protein CAPTEDRAFT_213201 [Capitella teleta]|eukprot:ELT95906.1 hypothetical protein CAPTEDRAFT_213201 [Capitella teleta]